MLNIEKHKQILSKILIELASEKQLSTKLGFKGGTALFFFYDLDRFSTDLDFDLLGEEDTSAENIEKIITSNITLVDKKLKRFTWYWQGSYEKGWQTIKVEVNTRRYPNSYIVKDFRGFSVKVLSPEDMMAHKMCAVIDRNKLQNRDLYDLWFMLNKNWQPNEAIIKLRMGFDLKEYWSQLLATVRNLPTHYDVLNGLGEVLNESKKDWVKGNLLRVLEIQLASRS